MGAGRDEGYAGRGQAGDDLRVGGGEVDAQALDVAQRRDRVLGERPGRAARSRTGSVHSLRQPRGLTTMLVDRLEAGVGDDRSGRGR